MTNSLQASKIPLWQPYDRKPSPERLLWLKALADGNQKAIQVELLKCRDPWYWIMNWVLTENSHSESLSVFEKFPDEAYLYYVVRILQRERFTAWPKSRQVLMTWVTSAFYLHDSMWLPSRLNFVQSKKEDDADEVLERANLIYSKQPKFIKEWQPVRRTKCLMKFSRNRSRMIAIPEGPEHLRSYTATGLLNDETVFQSDVEKMLTAADPSLGKSGRLTLLSSVGPSAFQMVCMDTFKA